MKKWEDDYLSSNTLPKTISGTSDKLSTNETGIKESVVPENARCVLDDILKEADQLIYDLDDVPLFEIEAAENSLLEDIRHHFEIDAEENSLIEEIKRHCGIDTKEDCSIEDVKYCFAADSEENSLPEDVRQHLGIDSQESISVRDIKLNLGSDEDENNLAEDIKLCFEIDPPDENTLERKARDILNNVLMKLGRSISFQEDGLVPDKYKEIPVTLSAEKSEDKSLFLKKWKSAEFQPPLYSTNFISNDMKIEKGIYGNEPRTSVESMEKKRSECSASETGGMSSVKTRSAVSCSNSPRVIIPRNTVEEPFPSFSTKNSHFNWRKSTELLDGNDVSLDEDREVYRDELYRPDNYLENKARKYYIAKNEKISAERNEEAIERKSDVSSSDSFKATVSRETIEKPDHSLKAKFPEKSYISLPIPSDIIVSKETVGKVCYPSKVKTSPKSEIVFPTSFKSTNSRENVREIRHSCNPKHLLKPKVSSPAPHKVTNSKEFLTKDNHFDWQRWLEACDSNEDVLPPIPKCRVIKSGRQPKSICHRFLSLLASCLCLGRKKKQK